MQFSSRFFNHVFFFNKSTIERRLRAAQAATRRAPMRHKRRAGNPVLCINICKKRQLEIRQYEINCKAPVAMGTTGFIIEIFDKLIDRCNILN